jgi:Helix-turn-helix domain
MRFHRKSPYFFDIFLRKFLMHSMRERLDAAAPPPSREVMTIPEIAPLLDMADGSLRNMCSDGRMPFQVLKIGGRVKVSKDVFARYLLGLTEEEQTKPKRAAGRPKNSDGIQRYAAGLLLTELDRLKQEHIDDVSSALAGQIFIKEPRVSM